MNRISFMPVTTMENRTIRRYGRKIRKIPILKLRWLYSNKYCGNKYF